MIIARFGSTWAGATALPGGMMSDDYGTDRAAIAARVGGLDGEFDFVGDEGNPIGPVRVTKTAIVTATSWAGVETALDALRAALGGDESLLWGECRDGSHRWAYAKCTGISDPDRAGQYNHCPVTIEFVLPEGLWYSETLHTANIADGSSATLVNAGNIPATVALDTAGGAAITATHVTNSTNGSGFSINTSAAGTYALAVDSAAYSITQYLGSTDFFSLLTPNLDGRLWLTLEPGDNTVTTGSTGGTASNWNLYWRDTWVM